MERKPVKAGLVEVAESWPWSSAAAQQPSPKASGFAEPAGPRGGLARRKAQGQAGQVELASVAGRADAGADGARLQKITAGWISTWRECLREQDEDGLPTVMRRHENTAGPLGDRSFVERVAATLGRNLVPHNPGPR